MKRLNLGKEEFMAAFSKSYEISKRLINLYIDLCGRD